MTPFLLVVDPMFNHSSMSSWHITSHRVYMYIYPIGSMYGIFTNIYPINDPNVGKYTIHGSYGYICMCVSIYAKLDIIPTCGCRVTCMFRPTSWLGQVCPSLLWGGIKPTTLGIYKYIVIWFIYIYDYIYNWLENDIQMDIYIYNYIYIYYFKRMHNGIYIYI